MGLVSVFRSLFVLVSLALLAIAPANATPGALRIAIFSMDREGLRDEAYQGSDAEKALARAVELAWNHQDEAAAKALAAAADLQTEPFLKATALIQLNLVLERMGNYEEAARVAGEAIVAAPEGESLEGLDALATALSGKPPTRAEGSANGRAELQRANGLMFTPITINGVTVSALIDTGANYSLLSESVAKKMGLTILDADVKFRSSVKDELSARLAVADRMTFGGVDFTNVVFSVVPDSDVTYEDGAGLNAIVGMPVLFQVGRIELTHGPEGEVLAFGRETVAAIPGERNILLNGNALMLIGDVIIDGARKDITLLLDTGASGTSLDIRFLIDFRFLLRGADIRTTEHYGIGGKAVKTDTRILHTMELKFGDGSHRISNARVNPDQHFDRHGVVGMDLLGNAFVIDFDAGRLVVR